MFGRVMGLILSLALVRSLVVGDAVGGSRSRARKKKLYSRKEMLRRRKIYRLSTRKR
jgi:hypothetical protein